MNAAIQRAHRIWGWTLLAAFVATGVALRLGYRLPLLDEADPARYTLRSNHVYLLFAALVNLALGWTAAVAPPRRPRLDRFGSVLVFLAPLVLLAAFLVEGPNPSPVRPLTGAGVVLVALGAFARFAAGAGRDAQRWVRPLSLHELLDTEYGPDGAAVLRQRLRAGADPNAVAGPRAETPLHVAVRRRRLDAVDLLLDAGADIDAVTLGGKTAYQHAVRRGFTEVAERLRERGARTDLDVADHFALAVAGGRLDDARRILAEHPGVARTGNPEEDRLLADLAGRDDADAVAFLLEAGADLTATGLDSGTPLHCAAWFGQVRNVRLLVDAGAPLDLFDETHHSSPIGWAVHGSRACGGASERQEAYVEIVDVLLAAGSSLRYPGPDDGGAYLRRLRADASPAVLDRLPAAPPAPARQAVRT